MTRTRTAAQRLGIVGLTFGVVGLGELRDARAETGGASGDAASTSTAASATSTAATATTPEAGEHPTWVGLHYRGTVVPKFLLNLFVDEGASVYSNSIGLEYELRADRLSRVFSLSYTEYGTSDLLFLQKGKPATDAAFYSDVNSSMKAIYATADYLWSTPIVTKLDFEYGLGFGVGVVFGDLSNNWVYQTQTGPLTASNGTHFSPCPSENGQRGCNKGDHENATVAKVGSYTEPSWFGGGSKPVFLPYLTPEIGVRLKATDDIAVRLTTGFGLTGFWFGLGGSYGIGAPSTPSTPKKTTP